METLNEFKAIFDRNVKDGNYNFLADFFHTASKYFETITTDESEMALEIVLDKQTGLVSFLISEINRPCQIPNVISSAFKFLTFLIEQFKDHYEPYIKETEECCKNGVIYKSTFIVKTSAGNAFRKLIEIFGTKLHTNDIVKEIMSKRIYYNTKDRSILLSVVACISRYCPSDITAKCSNIVYQDILTDLEHQANCQSEPRETEIYLTALLDLSHSYSLLENSTNTCEQFYIQIKKIITRGYSNTKKVIMRTAVILLAEHMRCFKTCIFKDYDFWHIFFTKLTFCQEQYPNKNCNVGMKALKSYYKIMSEIFTEEKSVENIVLDTVFLKMKKELEKGLKAENSLSHKLALLIYGYGQMAAPCKHYLSEAHVDEMFTIISRKIMLFFCEYEKKEYLKYVPEFQEALSKILQYIDNASVFHLYVLTKLSILLIKRFPELDQSLQEISIQSLYRTIQNVENFSQSLCQEYFRNITYFGVVETCSHVLYINAEIKRDFITDEFIVTYKNYLSLWKQLIAPVRGLTQRMSFISGVISAFLELIKKLNLKTKVKKDCTLTDIALSQIAVNEADFCLFINLTDFYAEIIEECDERILEPWLSKFLFETIKYSYKNPMISGFYKVIRAILKKLIVIDMGESYYLSEATSHLVNQYLSHVLGCVHNFSNELQISCVRLILDMPLHFAHQPSLYPSLISQTVLVFKVALTVNSGDFSLATTALTTLEKWRWKIDDKSFNELLRQVLPYLEPFLQSKQSAVEFSHNILRNPRKVVKKVRLIDTSHTLETFQRRILLFFGSLNSDIVRNYVYQRSLNTEATWNKKDLLQYMLPFPDVRVEIYFDKILPRVIELALTSGDRRTKVVACEVLHCILSVILGSEKVDLCLNGTLCSALLKLGCDSDEIVRQIYHPYVLQLMHYLSSRSTNVHYANHASKHMLDSIFNGLADDSASPLRDFCGICLAEFVSWSVKHLSSEDLEKCPINIHAVVRKMYHFALHTVKKKRVAAAIAFNYLYIILCEEEVANIYWLELLYCFVKGLDGCNDARIISAITHIEQFLILKEDEFNNDISDRRRPVEFGGRTLSDAVMWLLCQCGSLDECHRKKSMELFIKLAPLVRNCSSAREFIGQYLETNGMQQLNTIILKNLQANFDKNDIENFNILSRSLDCYTWILNENLISPELVFGEENEQSKLIINATMSFMSNLVEDSEVDKNHDNDNSQLLEDNLKLEAATCTTILKLISFLEECFKLNDDYLLHVPCEFWCVDLFKLLSSCILVPSSFQFYLQNVEQSEILQHQLNSLLNVIQRKSNPNICQKLQSAITNCLDKVYNPGMNIAENVKEGICQEHLQFVSGLLLLHKCGIFSELAVGQTLVNEAENKIYEVFEALANINSEHFSHITYNAETINYLENVLELLLLRYEPSLIQQLMELVTRANDTILISNKKVTQGEHFLNKFQAAIFRGMLRNVKETVAIFSDILQVRVDKTLRVIEELVTFTYTAHRDMLDIAEMLARELILKCLVLERLINNMENRMKIFVNIYRTAVRMLKDPSEISKRSDEYALYEWILRQLNTDDIEVGVEFLQNFLICLNDSSPIPLWLIKRPKHFAENNNIRFSIINCFEILLQLVSVTKSQYVFKIAVTFAAGACKEMFSEKFMDYLKSYFSEMSPENATNSLQLLYTTFLDLTESKERLDVLQYFLTPVLLFCTDSIIMDFYQNNIKDMYDILELEINSEPEDAERIIVSKIGSYNLIGYMFTRLNEDSIFGKHSIIARKIFGEEYENRKLVQELLKKILNIRRLKCSHVVLKEITRQLHCAAYNCFIAVQTFQSLPQRKRKFVNIRRSWKEQRSTSQVTYSYISHYDFASSTLNEDVNAFDFNDSRVLPAPNVLSADKNVSVEYESVDFNEHECMQHILGLLNHMIKNEIIKLPEEPESMPQWLQGFYNALFSKHNNPILNIVTEYLNSNSLNYIITDILLLLIEWQVCPEKDSEIKAAAKLIEQIIDQTIKVDGKEFEYNVELLRTLIQFWKHQVTFSYSPDKFQNIMKSYPKLGVTVILIYIVNGKQNEVIAKIDNMLEYLTSQFIMWKNIDEDIILHICEAVGLIFLQFRDCEIPKSAKELKCSLEVHFHNMSNNLTVKCTYALCKSNPEFGKQYAELALRNINNVTETVKQLCFEIVLLLLPSSSSAETIKYLRMMQLETVMKNKIKSCDRPGLRIIDKLVPLLNSSDLLPFANVANLYVKDKDERLRDVTYNIFMNIFKKYMNNISEDVDGKQLMQLSKNVLLSGFFDLSETLYKKVIHFWTEDIELPEKAMDRLIKLLDMYMPNDEEYFHLFLCLTMLSFTSKCSTSEYERILFRPLMENCNYNNYNIVQQWRMRNLESIAPLFVRSLASEMNQVFTLTNYDTLKQSLTNSSYVPSSEQILTMHATQDRRFYHTIETNNTINEGVDKLDTSYRIGSKLSKKIISDQTTLKHIHALRQMKTNMRREQIVQEESARQKYSVKVYRQYRLGDFPDVEISHKSFLQPLSELIKKDWLICKHMLVSLVSSLLNMNYNNEQLTKISKVANIILSKRRGMNPIINVILEVLLNCESLNYDADTVAKVAKLNGVSPIGILLLENKLICSMKDNEPPIKRIRIENDDNSKAVKWIHLASLYESMNELDVVLSIFGNYVPGSDLKEASFAQVACDWQTAKYAYERAYETETELVQEHCIHSMYECLRQLSQWKEIDTDIKRQVKDLEVVWDEKSRKQWLLPWIFCVKMHLILDNEEIENFDKKLESWLGTKQFRNRLMHQFGEELAIFYIHESEKSSLVSNFLKMNLNEIREQWLYLNPLSAQVRIAKLSKLRGIYDINSFLETLKARDTVENTLVLVKNWRRHLPSKSDDLTTWNMHVAYRRYFSNILEEKFNLPDNILKKLKSVVIQHQREILDVSVERRNQLVAKRHYNDAKKFMASCSTSTFKHMFPFSVSAYKNMCAELSTEDVIKIRYYGESWQILHNSLSSNKEFNRIKAKEHIADLAMSLRDSIEKSTKLISILFHFTSFIPERLSVTSQKNDNVIIALEKYAFTNLKSCCDTKNYKDLGSCYLKLARYCYDKIGNDTDGLNVELKKDFVKSTLRSLCYNVDEAAHYVPCLLKPEYFENCDICNTFENEASNVPVWRFLMWQTQLLSQLRLPFASNPMSKVILSIIKRLIEEYPNAVIYSFRLTLETNPDLLLNPEIALLKQHIFDNQPKLNTFLKAMQFVVQPELYLLNLLFAAICDLAAGKIVKCESFLANVFQTRENYVALQGKIYETLLGKYRNKIKMALRNTGDAAIKELKQLSLEVKEALKKRIKKYALKDYSPWLFNCSGHEVEVPGQYCGDRQPTPRYHATIAKFEPNVDVMRSAMMPIKITIIGNDANSYSFLVKSGCDLRLDQRIQQAFMVMNKTLQTDMMCKQRNLCINTYNVIPFSTTFGLIQWINGTKTLRDFITFSETNNTHFQSIAEKYDVWIKKANPRQYLSQNYKEAVKKYDANVVKNKMQELINDTYWELLRKTFIMLSSSPECFVAMRHNFIITYATKCIAHWILGIGDRHLSNILIKIKSGQCLGIDFGLAFGGGVDQAVPELMPFRLTPQILGLLKPFTENDLLGLTMTNVVRALRKGKGPLMACLNIFVHEPLNWSEYINKLAKRNEEEEPDVKWLPKRKINFVDQKLSGKKPSLITLEELRINHNDEYYPSYTCIVNGIDDNHQTKRSTFKDNDLSPEEQVQCLLDQATDLNILGRSYKGWEPWL